MKNGNSAPNATHTPNNNLCSLHLLARKISHKRIAVIIANVKLYAIVPERITRTKATQIPTTAVIILCNIAVSYCKEGKLEKVIEQLQKVKQYFENTQVDFEERSNSELLMLSNLGQCLGKLGDTVAAKEIDEQAIELCLKSGKRGILFSLLYNSALEREKLCESKEETLETLIQAYYVAELGKNTRSMKYIEEHIKEVYGDVPLY